MDLIAAASPLQGEFGDVQSITRTLPLVGRTAVDLLAALNAEPGLFVLEGTPCATRTDTRAYLCCDPYLRVSCWANGAVLAFTDGRMLRINADPFCVLGRLCATYRDRAGGACVTGYMTYECAAFTERIHFSSRRVLKLPRARFTVPRTVLALDEHDGTIAISRYVFPHELSRDARASSRAGASALDAAVRKVRAGTTPSESRRRPLSLAAGGPCTTAAQRHRDRDRDWFLRAVARSHEYIAAGDAFQIVLSRRLSIPLRHPPQTVYARLRDRSPAPFMFYLDDGSAQLVGASPELLVEVRNGRVHHRPIAGTRRRSSLLSQADVFAELTGDEKECAEHVMLVDLARNDIARVCRSGSLEVEQLMGVEEYPDVVHMESHISGAMRPGTGPADALRASFPAGTVTGAPKVRAMQLIGEMEQVQREFYAGAIVKLDFDATLTSVLAIRTLLVRAGVCHLQAGAGIVYDSVPEREWLETENKLVGCLSAVT